MPSFKEVLAKRLKQARTDAGLTQAKLAAAVDSCGVSCTQSQIAGYENAASKSIPDAEKLAAIAKTLEKSADWLCGLDIKGNSEAESKTISPNLWLRYFLAIISDSLITEGLKVEGGFPLRVHRPNIVYINHIKADDDLSLWYDLENPAATINFYGGNMANLFKKLAIIKSVANALPQDMLESLMNDAIGSYSFLFDVSHRGEKEFADFDLND